MKNLLYVAAIAVLFTSCSVDSLQDENSIDQSETISKATSIDDNNPSCYNSYLINLNGDKRGHVKSYVDQEQGTLKISLITYNNWKIKKSKLYFGSEEYINEAGIPSLFDLNKYDYTESFIDGIYTANYTFSLKQIKEDFVLLALLVASDGVDTENVMSLDGDLLPEEGGSFIIRDLISNCL